jgi:flagellar motor switch protein FliM
MDKVLSQEEINALFSVMSSESPDLGVEPDKKPELREVANYDFHRADRIPQDQLRSIQLLHDHFSHNFASSLSAYLRNYIDIGVVSVEQISYSSFIKALPDPTLFVSIGMRPMDGGIAMEIDPSLAFPMIDMILGGPGCASAENRTLTEIELSIIEGVIKIAMRDLQIAWRSIMEMEFYVDGKGTKAQMFQIASPMETVIAVHLELKSGEIAGMMNLCMPSRMLKLLRNKFDQQWSGRRQKTSGNESERLMELIKAVPVSLSCEIRNSKLTVNDALEISVGDIIELNEHIQDPISLCVGGIPKFLGNIAQRRGKKAFEIAELHTA